MAATREQNMETNQVQPKTGSKSMHDNVPVWDDGCCSCEAEPYWREAIQEAEKEQADKA